MAPAAAAIAQHALLQVEHQHWQHRRELAKHQQELQQQQEGLARQRADLQRLQEKLRQHQALRAGSTVGTARSTPDAAQFHDRRYARHEPRAPVHASVRAEAPRQVSPVPMRGSDAHPRAWPVHEQVVVHDAAQRHAACTMDAKGLQPRARSRSQPPPPRHAPPRPAHHAPSHHRMSDRHRSYSSLKLASTRKRGQRRGQLTAFAITTCRASTRRRGKGRATCLCAAQSGKAQTHGSTVHISMRSMHQRLGAQI